MEITEHMKFLTSLRDAVETHAPASKGGNIRMLDTVYTDDEGNVIVYAEHNTHDTDGMDVTEKFTIEIRHTDWEERTETSHDET